MAYTSMQRHRNRIDRCTTLARFKKAGTLPCRSANRLVVQQNDRMPDNVSQHPPPPAVLTGALTQAGGQCTRTATAA
jgi:hypothetical protein